MYLSVAYERAASTTSVTMTVATTVLKPFFLLIEDLPIGLAFLCLPEETGKASFCIFLD